MRTPTFVLVLVLALPGCRTTPQTETALPPRPARINHLAFFTLQDPADTAALIADCDALLATIPGVTSYYAGTHLDVGRDSVDGNYDVGFFVGFETEEDYAAYVVHPNHVRVVTTWKPKLKSLRVHDVLDAEDRSSAP